MKIFKFNHFILVFALAFALPFQASCQGKPSKSSSMTDHILRSQAKMDFYGKVVDDQGNPIAGAAVKIHTRHYSPNPQAFFLGVSEHERKTDAKGCFSVEGMVGLDLMIAEINKIGYEFKISGHKTSFDYEKGNTMVHKPDPRNPVVYRLRKKGEETYVVNNTFSFVFSAKGPRSHYGRDFLAQAAIEAKDGKIPFEVIGGEGLEGVRRQCDLNGRAAYDPQTKTWTVVLAPGNSDGGLIVSDRILYEAPKEGYELSHTFLLKNGEVLDKRYIYLRARNPAIYMRLDLGGDLVQADADHIWFTGDLFINPYGERNLEMATGLPVDVSTRLKREIREAFARGGRPGKPDLPKLVQEWEQNRPLKDKVKGWFKK